MTEKLTPKQTDLLKVYAQKWISVSRCTRPANRALAEKGVYLAYELAGLAKPEQIIWCDSTLAMAHRDVETENSVAERVWDQSVNTARDNVRAAVSSEVWLTVRDDVMGQVWNAAGDLIVNALWSLVRDHFSDLVYGQHDANALGFYAFFAEVLGLETETKTLAGAVLIAQNAGWWMPYEKTCFISERMTTLKVDDNDVLHCADGPAVGYKDGFALYIWHGVTLPDWFITKPEKLTPQTALQWQNIEQRRAACEIIGWDTILKELDAITIDKDNDPEIGELVEVSLPDSGKERFLRVQCGTGRAFALPVPPNMQTALQAQAWTWGLSEVEFIKPEVRT